MKKYFVSIPIAGSFTLEVEAADKKAAIKAAWKKIEDTYNVEDAGELEWEFHERLTSGNVLHASQNEVDVSEIRD